jgi:hypothetical protein
MRLVFGFMIACITASSAIAAPVYLVRDGKPVATIITPDDAPAVVTESVRDMVDIIHRMSGAQLSVVRKSEWTPGTSPVLLLDMKHDSSLKPFAYRVQRKGKRVTFSGGNDMGVVNGIYAFLSKELGCRWYIPGDLGTYIPQRKTIKVNRLNMSDAPDFERSRGFGRSHDGRAGRKWLLRNGMLGFGDQGRGHNWRNIISPSMVNTHPEYFAQYNGKRSDQLCTTHPDVIDSAVAVATRFFDEKPTSMYSMSPNDNERFCQCERCKALDHKLGADTVTSPTGWFTPRLVTFMNQVAERVTKKHPDSYFTFYAYNAYTDPPAAIRIHPNVIPIICKSPWLHCVHHAVTDPKCKRNRPMKQNIIDWNATASRVFLREYYGHWAWYGPHAIVHSIRRDIPWMQKQGVDALNSETHANWWTQGLNFTVATNLFWDVDADVDVMIREYYEHLYGPAAAHMTAYGNAFEELVANMPYDDDEHLAFAKYMTPEFLAGVGVSLKSAEQAIGSADIAESQREIYRRRLRKVRAGYRVVCAQAPTMEAPSDPASAILSGGESMMGILAEMEADTSLHDVIELRIARSILKKQNAPTQAYRDAWNKATLSPGQRIKLKDALRAGHTREFAKGIGCVTDWNLIGMFGGDGKGMSTVCPPELGIDLNATYKGKDGPVRWVRYQNDNPFGMIDLRKYFAPQSSKDVITYLYTEIDYATRGPDGSHVRMYIGANDGVTIWQNGQIIYHSDNERPLTLDEDRLTVRMYGGKNRFLVKVYNAGGGYGFSMRIVHWDYVPMRISPAK